MLKIGERNIDLAPNTIGTNGWTNGTVCAIKLLFAENL
jgi:hypothetical protein